MDENVLQAVMAQCVGDPAKVRVSIISNCASLT